MNNDDKIKLDERVEASAKSVEEKPEPKIKHLDSNSNWQLTNGVLLSTESENKSYRFKTHCCGLGQLSLNDESSLEFIQDAIAFLKEENNTPASLSTRNGHERAYFVMTLPYEKQLEENLELAGFSHIATIHRRNYVPEDSMLKMWLISW